MILIRFVGLFWPPCDVRSIILKVLQCSLITLQRGINSFSSSSHRLILIQLLITFSFSLWLRPLFTVIQSALLIKTDVHSWETAEWKSELCSAMYYIVIIKISLYKTIYHLRFWITKPEQEQANQTWVLWNIEFVRSCALKWIGIASHWREQRQRDLLSLLFMSCLNALSDKKQKFLPDAREHNEVWRATSSLRQWRLPRSTWTQRNIL